MKTAAQRKHDFIEALRRLLKEHGAELSISDEMQRGFQVPYAEVTMIRTRDGDECTAEYVDFRLPNTMP